MREPSDAWRYYFKTLKTHWKQRKPWNNGSVRQTVIGLTINFYLFPLDCSSCKFHRVQIRTQQERENARQVSKRVWLCLKCLCEGVMTITTTDFLISVNLGDHSFALIQIHQSLIATDIQGPQVASVGQSKGLQWKTKILKKIGRMSYHILFSYNIQFPWWEFSSDNSFDGVAINPA